MEDEKIFVVLFSNLIFISMRQYKNYTDKDIIANAANVKSLAGLLKSLGLRPAGGSFNNMKRNLQRLNVDTSHWTGQGWNSGQRLKDWTDYTRAAYLKPHLIGERTHKCESCKQTTWMENKIPLEVHHIDGDRTNNNIDNLQLLCCNCHALTDSWKRKK
jgi:hypothetical protein